MVQAVRGGAWVLVTFVGTCIIAGHQLSHQIQGRSELLTPVAVYRNVGRGAAGGGDLAAADRFYGGGHMLSAHERKMFESFQLSQPGAMGHPLSHVATHLLRQFEAAAEARSATRAGGATPVLLHSSLALGRPGQIATSQLVHAEEEAMPPAHLSHADLYLLSKWAQAGERQEARRAAGPTPCPCAQCSCGNLHGGNSQGYSSAMGMHSHMQGQAPLPMPKPYDDDEMQMFSAMQKQDQMIVDQKKAKEERLKQGSKAPKLAKVQCGNQCFERKGVWCCRMQ